MFVFISYLYHFVFLKIVCEAIFGFYWKLKFAYAMHRLQLEFPVLPVSSEALELCMTLSDAIKKSSFTVEDFQNEHKASIRDYSGLPF